MDAEHQPSEDTQAASPVTGNVADFAAGVLSITDDPNWNQVSGTDALQRLDDLYQSNNWDPEAKQIYADTADAIRQSKGVEADVTPYQESLARNPFPVDLDKLNAGQDRDFLAKDVDDWAAAVKSDMEQNYGTDYLQIKKVVDQDIDAKAEQAKRTIYGRDKGAIGDFLSRTSESAAGFIAELSGSEHAVKAVKDYFHENPAFDDSVEAQLASGLGQGLAQAGLMYATGGLGAVATGSKLAGSAIGTAFLFGTIGKVTYEDGYNRAYQLTGDRRLATEAGLYSLPGAALYALTERFVLKGTLPAFTKGLGPALQSKSLALASVAGSLEAGLAGAAAQGAGGAAQELTTQLAVQSVTDTGRAPLDPEQIGRTAAITGAVGGIFAGARGFFEGPKAAEVQRKALDIKKKADAETAKLIGEQLPKRGQPERPEADVTPEPEKGAETPTEPPLTNEQQVQLAAHIDEFYHGDLDEIYLDGVQNSAQIPPSLLQLTNLKVEDTPNGVRVYKPVPLEPKDITSRTEPQRVDPVQSENIDEVNARIRHLERGIQEKRTPKDIETDIAHIQEELEQIRLYPAIERDINGTLAAKMKAAGLTFPAERPHAEREMELLTKLGELQAEFKRYQDTRESFRSSRRARQELDKLYVQRTKLENPDLVEEARLQDPLGIERTVDESQPVADSENLPKVEGKAKTPELKVQKGKAGEKIDRAREKRDAQIVDYQAQGALKVGDKVIKDGEANAEPRKIEKIVEASGVRYGFIEGQPERGIPLEGLKRVGPQARPLSMESSAGGPEVYNSEVEYSSVFPKQSTVQNADGSHEGVVKRVQRPQVAPIQAESTRSVYDLLKDIQQVFNAPINYGLGEGRSKRTLGQYFPGLAKVFVKFHGDLDTALHELAHAVDDKLKLGSIKDNPELGVPESPLVAELISLSRGGSGGPDRSFQYNLAEGMAEYMRGYVLNPEHMAREFPEAHAYFESKVDPEFRSDLDKIGQAVREHYGVGVTARLVSNIAFETPTRWQAAAKWYRNMTGEGLPGSGLKITGVDRIITKWLDDRHALVKGQKFLEMMQGIEGLQPKDDPTLLFTKARRSNVHFNAVMEAGWFDQSGVPIQWTTDSNGNPIGGGFHKILEPLARESADEFERLRRIGQVKLIAERTIEKTAQREVQQGGSVFSGPISGFAETSNAISKGQTDYQVAKEFLREFAEMPEQDRLDINESNKRYRDWADQNLQYLRRAGVLGDDAYKRIKQNNEQYVTMYRYMEEDGAEAINGRSTRESNNALLPFKGSGRQIDDVDANLMKATYKSIAQGDANQARWAFTRLLETTRGMYDGDPKEIGTVGHRVDNEVKGETTEVWNNGQREHWLLDKDVSDALNGFARLPGHSNIFTKAVDVLRFGVINTPPYAVRNYIRDLQHGLGITESGTAESLANVFKRSGPLDKYLLAVFGGDQAGPYFKDRVNFHRALNSAIEEVQGQGHTVFMPGVWWEKYKKVIESAEKQGRLREFRNAFERAKERGMDDENAYLYAGYKAADMLDFATAGSVMRIVNQYIPFSNAAVQAIRNNTRYAVKNPASALARLFIYAVAPSIMLRQLAKSGGYEQEYDQAPDYLRDLFFGIKVGPNNWVYVPKNYETGVIAAGVDRAMKYAQGDKHAWDGYLGNLIRVLAPVDEGSFSGPFRPIAEASANYDYFRGKTIVPTWEAEKDLDRRKLARSASEFGQKVQAIGEALSLGDTAFGRKFLDARTVDHLVQGFFGNVGKIMLDASNIGTEGRGKPLTPSDLTGVVRETPIWGAKDVQFVFNYAAERGVHPQDKKLEGLKDLINAYFEAEGGEAKDAAGQRVLAEASRLRGIIDTYGDRAFGLKPVKR